MMYSNNKIKTKTHGKGPLGNLDLLGGITGVTTTTTTPACRHGRSCSHPSCKFSHVGGRICDERSKFGSAQVTQYHDKVRFFDCFIHFAHAKNTVGAAAYVIGEKMNKAVTVKNSNPNFLTSIAVHVTRSACILLSPGSDHLSKSTIGASDIVSSFDDLNRLTTPFVNKDLDVLLPKLRTLSTYNNTSSVKLNDDHVKLTILAVASGVKHHLFKLRNSLALDKAIFDKKLTSVPSSALPSPTATSSRPPPTKPTKAEKIASMISTAVKKAMEENNLTPPPPAADEVDCDICCLSYSRDSLVVCGGGHSLCSECLNSHVQAELDKVRGSTQMKLDFGARKGSILCPNHYDSGCTHTFHPTDLAGYLGSQHKDTFSDLWSIHDECIAAHEFNKSAAQAQRKLDKIVADRDASLAAAKKKFEHDQLEEALQKEFGGSAFMCRQCNYGPILKDGCSDLSAHHGQSTGRGRINNACPSCGWFSASICEWPRWNGKLPSSG
ncbi:hypothetical protein TrST_g3487 [Triparma strigata]|uniref:RING-type domain-containing protein n=1 Tax=Triparma strigata TaxID=1606541 RepID=A0A9W7AWX1_9STRA|nr:hypothetical protein TrST_g3487 [Triparma strigata]